MDPISWDVPAVSLPGWEHTAVWIIPWLGFVISLHVCIDFARF